MKLFYLTFLLLLVSCVDKDVLKKTFKEIDRKDISKIEYFKKKSNDNLFEKRLCFTITDKEELIKSLEEIKLSKENGPWKGLSWNLIKLHFSDTIIILCTDEKIIGAKNSGWFYDLPKKNFITRNSKNCK